MKTLAKSALVGTALAAAIVMGAGSASAATVGAAGSAGTGTPTAAYQVCGTAYVGADAHVGAPPATAKAVAGLPITGQLYNASNVAVGAPMSTTTASNGTWCITGTSAMSSTVTGGGSVKMSALGSFTDSGVTYTGKWSGAGTDATLGGFEFYNHAYPAPSFTADRAWKVNAVFN